MINFEHLVFDEKYEIWRVDFVKKQLAVANLRNASAICEEEVLF